VFPTQESHLDTQPLASNFLIVSSFGFARLISHKRIRKSEFTGSETEAYASHPYRHALRFLSVEADASHLREGAWRHP